MYIKTEIVLIVFLLLVLPVFPTGKAFKDDIFPWEDIDDLEAEENGFFNKKYVGLAPSGAHFILPRRFVFTSAPSRPKAPTKFPA